MRIGGFHARVSTAGCEMALVAVDATARRLDAQVVHLLPADADEATALPEIYSQVHRFLSTNPVEAFIYWPPDPPPGGSGERRAGLVAVSRAEGAALAAAGATPSIDIFGKVSGAGVRAAGGGSTKEAVRALADALKEEPESVRRAVAAALTWHVRR